MPFRGCRDRAFQPPLQPASPREFPRLLHHTCGVPRQRHMRGQRTRIIFVRLVHFPRLRLPCLLFQPKLLGDHHQPAVRIGLCASPLHALRGLGQLRHALHYRLHLFRRTVVDETLDRIPKLLPSLLLFLPKYHHRMHPNPILAPAFVRPHIGTQVANVSNGDTRIGAPTEIVATTIARPHHHRLPRPQAPQIDRFLILAPPDQRRPLPSLSLPPGRRALHVRHRDRSCPRQPPPRRAIRQRQRLRRDWWRRCQNGHPLLHVHFFQVRPPDDLHIGIVQRLLSMQEWRNRGVRRRCRIGLRPRIQMRRKHQRSISLIHRQPGARFPFRQFAHPLHAEIDPLPSAFTGGEFVQPLPRLVQRFAVNPVRFLPPLLQNHRWRASTQPPAVARPVPPLPSPTHQNPNRRPPPPSVSPPQTAGLHFPVDDRPSSGSDTSSTARRGQKAVSFRSTESLRPCPLAPRIPPAPPPPCSTPHPQRPRHPRSEEH